MVRTQLVCAAAVAVWALWCCAAANAGRVDGAAADTLPILTNLTLERSFRGVWHARQERPQNATGVGRSPLTAAEGTFFLMKLRQFANRTHVGGRAGTRAACDLVQAELVLRDGHFVGDHAANADVYGVFVPAHRALLLYTAFLRMKGNRVSRTLDMAALGDALAAAQARAENSLARGEGGETGDLGAFMERFVRGDFLTKQAQQKLADAKNKCPLLLAMQLSLDGTTDGKMRQGMTAEDAERAAQDTKLYGGPRDAVLLSGLMRGLSTCNLDTTVQARYLSPLKQDRATTLYVWLLLVVTVTDIMVFRMQYSATSSSQSVCFIHFGLVVSPDVIFSCFFGL